MDKLPDYLIENYIIPYLSSEDLFYKLRSLSSYYFHCARNKILLHFPEEMMQNLAKIIEFNMKEDLTKTFEEVTQKTLYEKRILLILMLQVNYSLLIKTILENTRDERAMRLIQFFYVITKNEAKQSLAREEKFDEIQQLAGQEESITETNNKIKDVCEEDDINYDINEYNIVYNSLDEEFLRNNNYTVNLYNFVSLFIDYCITKIRFAEIKVKLNIFLEQINEASIIWPKKKNFYEKTIDLVADTHLLSNGAKKMLNLFKKYDIENNLTDYNYEKEIIYNYKSRDEYQNIKSNRKKLNRVILRIHEMFAFFIKSINFEAMDNQNNPFDINIMKIKTFNVCGHIIPVEEFLFTLSMIKNKFCINESSFFLTRNYLHHYIYHEIYNIKPHIDENHIKKINNIINGNEENKNNDVNEKKEDIDAIKYITLLNENIGDGINNFDTLIENTKYVGEEINNSFEQLTKNLEKFHKKLDENNNKYSH